MEKVKIELPKKYKVGVAVLIPMTDDETKNGCMNIVSTLVETMSKGSIGTRQWMRSFKSHGKAIVTPPLIRSIAETKVEGLNEHFNGFHLPFEAFLEEEK